MIRNNLNIKPISTYLQLLILVLALSTPETAYEKTNELKNPSMSAEQAISTPLLQQKKKLPFPKELENIAWCESRNRQFDENGKVLRGTNRNDIGKFQINIVYWGAKAKALGHDLFTEEGNEAMALEIYRRHKTEPWIWSKPCWGNK